MPEVTEVPTILERSPEVQDKIQSLLDYQKDPEHSREEAKERSAELRMELVLDNAKLARSLTRGLEEDPTLTQKGFVELANSSGLIVHPETTEKFIKRIEHMKRLAVRARGILSDWADNDQDEIAKGITRTIAQEHGPKGAAANLVHESTELIDLPLAIGILLDEADFDAIDPKRNIGGFWAAKTRATRENFTNNPSAKHQLNNILIPVVAIRKPDHFGQVIQHEVGHVENSIFLGINDPRRRVMWKNIETEDALSSVKEISTLIAKSELNGDALKANPEYKKIVEYALSRAKDEILAEMRGSYGNPKDHVTTLRKQGEVYDYFEELGIPKDSDLYVTLWEDYDACLENFTTEALSLYKFYERNPAMVHRRPLFRWVLAQVPIDKWPQFLERSGFSQERRRFFNLRKRISQAFSEGKAGRIYLEDPEADRLETELLTIELDMMKDCSEMATNPILEILRKYERLAGDPIKQMEQTERFQMRQNVNAFIEEIDQLKESVWENATTRTVLHLKRSTTFMNLRVSYLESIRQDPKNYLEITATYKRELAGIRNRFR